MEFNTSYIPKCPLHDTNLNAAYVARLLSFMGDTCASYSYWTFGDVFEEGGVPFTPFHGGFGLVANGGIPKPTFWTFQFFGRLNGKAVLRNEHLVVTKGNPKVSGEDGVLHGVAWNPILKSNDEGLKETSVRLKLSLDLTLDDGEYLVLSEVVDEETCNPLNTWHNLGRPANPNEEQLKRIRKSAMPRMYTNRITVNGETYLHEIILNRNAVYYFTIEKIKPQNDRGFEM
jgi:xylan 1,4-beta-xylosidase